MNREDEIEKANDLFRKEFLEETVALYPKDTNIVCYGFYKGFNKAAEWADKNPKEPDLATATAIMMKVMDDEGHKRNIFKLENYDSMQAKLNIAVEYLEALDNSSAESDASYCVGSVSEVLEKIKGKT